MTITWKTLLLMMAGSATLVPSVAPGQQAATAIQTDMDAEAIERWANQLDSESAEERARAFQSLVAAGPRILPLLPEATPQDSVALREALMRVRAQLVEVLARSATQAARVTFQDTATLPAALNVLQQQTGNPPLWVPPDLPVPTAASWMWNETAYWAAIGDLERWLQRPVRWVADREQFGWRADETLPLATDVAGPLRLNLERVTLRPLKTEAADSQQLLRLEARLQLEPRLRTLFARVPMRNWTVQTAGQSFAPWSPEADYELQFPDRTSEVMVPLDFVVNPAEFQQDWSVLGELQVHVAAGREELTFSGPTLSRGAVLKRGQAQVTIRDARFVPTPEDKLEARIRIAVSFDNGGPAFESYRVSLFHRSAWLTDREGQKLPAHDFEIFAELDGGLLIEYRFPNLKQRPVDYQFTYEAPTKLAAIPARIHWSQLPVKLVNLARVLPLPAH